VGACVAKTPRFFGKFICQRVVIAIDGDEACALLRQPPAAQHLVREIAFLVLSNYVLAMRRSRHFRHVEWHFERHRRPFAISADQPQRVAERPARMSLIQQDERILRRHASANRARVFAGPVSAKEQA